MMQLIHPQLRDVCRAGASKRFRRYKSEQPEDVRQIKVSGDELDFLRRKREMLRSMSPEQALQAIEFHKDLNLFEALALARKEGKILVPNFVIDRILIETGESINSVWGWTGTAVIYKRPDAPFGKKVVYSWKRHGAKFTISASVPDKFRGKTNCALVVEHPDFDIADLGNNSFELRADEGSIFLVENFPKEEGYYALDEKCRIPVGESARKVSPKRHLRRAANDHVGQVAHDSSVHYYWGVMQYVSLCDRPSDGLGVALF